MKKILAIALTLAFVFALAVPAFATEENDKWFGLDVKQVKPESTETKGDENNYGPVVLETEEAEKTAEPAQAAEGTEATATEATATEAAATEATTTEEATKAPEATEAPKADFEAGSKVYFMVQYTIPYDYDFKESDLYKDGTDTFVIDFEDTNLKDVKFFDAYTYYCEGENCNLPTSDLKALTGANKGVTFDESKMAITVTYPYTIHGWVVVEGVVEQSAEAKLEVTVTYGDNLYHESASAVLNEGIKVVEASEAPKPGKNGGMTLAIVAAVSALSGVGVLGLRRKEN